LRSGPGTAYLTGMDLTPQQAVALRDAIRSRMNYLHRVKVRMYQLGVGPGDRLYDLFDAAEVALSRLAEDLHGRSLDAERRPWEPGPAPPG
jgi:hypothetical protein